MQCFRGEREGIGMDAVERDKALDEIIKAMDSTVKSAVIRNPVNTVGESLLELLTHEDRTYGEGSIQFWVWELCGKMVDIDDWSECYVMLCVRREWPLDWIVLPEDGRVQGPGSTTIALVDRRPGVAIACAYIIACDVENTGLIAKCYRAVVRLWKAFCRLGGGPVPHPPLR